MTHPVKGIDHCYILVDDLEQSAATYRQLGFTLSPRGLHSKHKGTGNYTIMFKHDYLELLGIVHEAEGNIKQRQRLADQGQGLHAIASRIDNAVAGREALEQLGFDMDVVNSFSRPITLPDGSEGVAAFDTVMYGEREVPQGLLFMCQHKTRDMVWRPELLNHANGAKGLAAISVISSSPDETASGYARLYAHGKVHEKHGLYHVETGPNSAPILVMDKMAIEKRFPGFDSTKTPAKAYASLAISVDSLAHTKTALDAGGIIWNDTPRGTIAVSPEQACGTILEFIAL